MWWAEKVQVEGQIKLLKMKPSAGNVRKVFAIILWDGTKFQNLLFLPGETLR